MTVTRSAILRSVFALLIGAGCADQRYLVGVADGGVSQPDDATIAMTESPADASTTTPPVAPPPPPIDALAMKQDGGVTILLPAKTTCLGTPQPMPVRRLRISPMQAADRVARFLWNERADQSLVIRAANMTTSADVGELARTLFKDARIEQGMRAFVQRWLPLDGLYTHSPGEPNVTLTTEVRQAMERDLERFVVEHILAGRGVEAVLAGPFTPSAEVAKALNDSKPRTGVFSQPAWLFLREAATRRGTALRERLLCEIVPPDPPGVDTTLRPPLVGKNTYRQRLENSVAPRECQWCHSLVDGLGFAFEGYDRVGRSRTTDDGLPIDATGSVSVQGGPTLRFDGPTELMRMAAATCEVQSCFARAVMQHALGGQLRGDEGVSVDEVAKAFRASNLSVLELMVAVVQSEAFLAP